MKLMVNGSTQEVPDEQTVAQLLETVGLSGKPCAVEVNKEVIPKREHEQRTLCEGDCVELVTLVGGG